MSRGAATALALRAGGMVAAGLAGVLLARSLGPAAYGRYSWAYAWAAALAVPAALGADQLLVREGGIRSARPAALRALVGSALRTVAVTTALIALAGAGALVLLAGPLDGRRAALLVALPIVPLAAVAAVAQGALVGVGRTARGLAPAALGRPVAFLGLAAIALAAGGLSPAGALALQLVATTGAAATTLWLLRRALGRSTAAAPPAGRWLAPALRMGGSAMVLIVDAQVGLLVLGTTGSQAGSGAYAAALLCTAPFALLFAAGRLPLGGVVARLQATEEHQRLQHGLRIATRTVAAAAAAWAALLLTEPHAVLDLFGGGFDDGATALRLLAVAHLLNAACAFNGLVLTMGGQERAALRAALGCLALDAALCLALVGPLGAEGAAIGVLVSVVVRNAANSLTAWRRLGLDTTVLGRGRTPAGDGSARPAACHAAPRCAR